MPRLYPTLLVLYCVAGLGQAFAQQPAKIQAESEPPATVPNAVVLPPASEAVASRLASIRQQIRAGAMQLALKRLEAEAPPVVPDKNWHVWSLQHWNLLILMAQWDELISTISRMPPGFPPAFEDEADIYKARALLELGRNTEASLVVRALLEQGQLSEDNLKSARSLLIDIYLKDNDFDNAQIEATRFDDEFKPQTSQWFIQRALIALQAGRADEAVAILAPVAASEAKYLQIYARLKAGAMKSAQALGAVLRLAGKKRVSEELKHFGEAIVVYAHQLATNSAGDADQLPAYVAALEAYLSSEYNNPYAYLVDFQAMDLVDAYVQHAVALTNRAQLLDNDDSAKYTLANQREEASQNKQALALYIALISQSESVELKIAAMNKAIKLLLEAEQPAVVESLFGDDKPLGDFGGIDSVLASQLVNYGLLSSKNEFVAAIAPHLNDPPEGLSQQAWLIQKARIDIFTGRFETASANIDAWLSLAKPLDGKQADQVLQLVFDLQSIDQHKLALKWLNQIKNNTRSSKHQREILYWMAESFEATGELIEAANHYTQSALAAANGFDDWGQSARYHAAQMLSKTGYYEDAERLYRSILSVAQDQARRSTVRQSLQQLWLLQQKNR